jgi:hypothetical protein
MISGGQLHEHAFERVYVLHLVVKFRKVEGEDRG